MEKIFVQLASYRDPQCQWTVKDLFEKATNPERVLAGICWQFDESEDRHCFEQPYPRPDQVRVLNFTPEQAQGAGWAHGQAQSLWQGEEYVLQIHSHMRFEPGWDDTLIGMLARCPSSKPALATCLAGYVPPDTVPYKNDARASFVFVHEVKPDDPSPVTLRGALVDKNEPLERPMHTPFWVGPFLFARAELFQEVPFDPHMVFYGEPLAYAARLFTHGWDLFDPDTLVLYHWWGRESGVAHPYREIGSDRQKRTHMRLLHLLRVKAATQSAAIEDIERYGLGDVRPIEDFWRFTGVNIKTGELTEQARGGRWNDSFAALASYRAQPRPAHPRIFVQIASYRDEQCQWTVKDLFEKAKHPERIFVGICWQYDKEADKDCFLVETRPEQVRVAAFDCRESRGVCWARYQIQQLWQGEEYTLMIDSHMRFEFNWDEEMIKDLALCDSPKPVMTNYPAGYTPPHDLEAGAKPTVQRAHPYEGGDIRFRGDNLDRQPEKPLRGAFIAAGLMFAKSDIIREVPYDPYLYFNQEELSLAARLFTHGWNVHSMRQVLVYHQYIMDPAKKKRRLHWEDNVEWGRLQDIARRRMDHMMGHVISDDPMVTRDLMIYGLGTERTLDEFSAFCGVDFKNRIISEKALRCGFIEDLSIYKDEPIYIPELDAHRTPQPTQAPPPVPLSSGPEIKIVTLAGSAITDWNTFHALFQQVFGFPEFYGRNMDAWIDCMMHLDDPDSAMSKVTVSLGGLVIIRLEGADEFRARLPQHYAALAESVASVNHRRASAGKTAIVALLPT